MWLTTPDVIDRLDQAIYEEIQRDMEPVYALARVLDVHPVRARRAIEALRAAGWRLEMVER